MPSLRTFVVATALVAAAACTQTAFGASASSRTEDGVLVITASGTFYEVGKAVGERIRDISRKWFSHNPANQQGLNLTRTNATYQAYNQSLFDTTNDAFPWLIEELRGVADGVLMPFEVVWFAFIRRELGGVKRAFDPSMPNPFPSVNASAEPRPLGDLIAPHCMDVRSDTAAEGGMWAHNEDSLGWERGALYVVEATITDADTGDVVQKFVAVSLPMTVAGTGFGFNRNGLMFTANTIIAKKMNMFPPANKDSAVFPINVLQRALFATPTIDDAVSLFARKKLMVSQSLNIGRFDSNAARTPVSPRFVNLETDPLGTLGVTTSSYSANADEWHGNFRGPRNHIYHANDYLYLSTPAFFDPTSAQRVNRLKELGTPKTMEDLKRSIGDTASANPIYRTGQAGLYTLLTAVVDPFVRSVSLFTTNPKNASNAPILVYPMETVAPSVPAQAGDDAPSTVNKGTGVVVIVLTTCVAGSVGYLLGMFWFGRKDESSALDYADELS